MSSEDRPVPYIIKVPSYTGETRDLRDTNNVVKRRAHSSQSNPQNNRLKYFIRVSRMKFKQTEASSRERAIEEKLEELDIKWYQSWAVSKRCEEQYEYYSNLCMKKNQAGDYQSAHMLLPFLDNSLQLIQWQNEKISRIQTQIKECKRQLQKLQAQKM